MSWAQRFVAIVGADLQSWQARRRRPLVVATGCSGSGAPSRALDALIGPGNYVEAPRNAPSQRHVGVSDICTWPVFGSSPDLFESLFVWFDSMYLLVL